MRAALYALGGLALVTVFVVRQRRSDRYRERSLILPLALGLYGLALLRGTWRHDPLTSASAVLLLLSALASVGFGVFRGRTMNLVVRDGELWQQASWRTIGVGWGGLLVTRIALIGIAGLVGRRARCVPNVDPAHDRDHAGSADASRRRTGAGDRCPSHAIPPPRAAATRALTAIWAGSGVPVLTLALLAIEMLMRRAHLSRQPFVSFAFRCVDLGPCGGEMFRVGGAPVEPRASLGELGGDPLVAGALGLLYALPLGDDLRAQTLMGSLSADAECLANVGPGRSCLRGCGGGLARAGCKDVAGRPDRGQGVNRPVLRDRRPQHLVELLHGTSGLVGQRVVRLGFHPVKIS